MMKTTILALGLMFSPLAIAEISVDTATGDATFKVDMETVSYVDAVKAAVAGKTVLRCKPKKLNDKKVYFSSSGAPSDLLECTPVELKINPKTGAPKWVNIK
jgi:hypothetical protein